MKEGPTEGPEDISTERLHPTFPGVLRNGVASLFLPFLPKLGSLVHIAAVYGNGGALAGLLLKTWH